MKRSRTRGRTAHWTFLALAAAATPVAQAQITLDGTLGRAGALAGPAFVIPADAGRQLGSNLFHSFGLFNVQNGERATFTGPTSVSNILARVTGGQASTINGGLGSDIAGANLYLINPAGVVFGANASLDISGSFHVSTADYLRLGADGRFDAKSPDASVLTVAPPSAFGFVSQTPASISFSGSTIEVPDSKTISVIGGDISASRTTLQASGGRLNIVALGSAGEVRPTDSPIDVLVEGATRMGSAVFLKESGFSQRGEGGGSIIIRAGRFVLDGSVASTSVSGPTNGDLLPYGGAGIDILANDVVLKGSAAEPTELNSNLSSGVAMPSPPIRIRAGTLEVSGTASINSVGLAASRGMTSGIQIEATEVDIHDGAIVRSTTAGAGNSGGIWLQTDRLKVRNGGSLYTLAFGGGAGNAGSLNINAREIILTSTPEAGYARLLTQTRDGTGSPGNVRITADVLSMGPRTEISSGSFGPQPAGDIDMHVRDISITGVTHQVPTGIFANARGDGNAGTITIHASTVRLDQSGSIQILSYQGGRGGEINLETSELVLGNGGFIASTAHGNGPAGGINVIADNVSITGVGYELPTGFFANAVGDGNAGTIAIRASGVRLDQFGMIESVTFRDGRGGEINLETGELVLRNGAYITSAALGNGSAGGINVIADNVSITGVSYEVPTAIIANARGDGNAGTIAIRASGVRLDQFSSIQSRTSQGAGGRGGEINLETGELVLGNGAFISSEARGTGSAGEINVIAGTLDINNAGAIVTEAVEAGGGSIALSVGERVYLENSWISTSVRGGGGDAGNISIDPRFVILNHSQIIANAFQGAGGNVSIVADNFIASPDSRVEASSELGISGTVSIRAPKTIVRTGLEGLKAPLLDVSSLVGRQCGVREPGRINTFVVAGRGGVPPDPDAPLSGSYAEFLK